MILTFRVVGFGWYGGGILLDSTHQSSKLIAIWTELEPLPKVYADPIAIIAGLLGFEFIDAAVYQSVASAWSAGIISRAIRIAGVLFGFVFAFWEFFTSFDLFGESIQLIALELLFWAIIASAEDMSITVVYESNL